MRECWINVYPDIPRIDGGLGPFLGVQACSRKGADEAAIGWGGARLLDVHERGRNLLLAGVGYRLHVRLKPEPEKYARLKQSCPDGMSMAQWEALMGHR